MTTSDAAANLVACSAKSLGKRALSPQDSARPDGDDLFVYQRDSGLARAHFLKRQQGRCAICRQAGARLVVDHEHSEMALVRGLLCDKCNQGLGYFLDHPGALEAAAAYLREHDARNDAYGETEDWKQRALKKFWQFPTDEQVRARAARIHQMIEDGYESSYVAAKFALSVSQVNLIYLHHMED